MLQKFRSNQKGFTLIELMIVIAIIGILAAIAVPQFMAYRMRGYHTMAASDLRNWVAAESALMQDGACYGVSDFSDNLNNPAGAGPAETDGTIIVGGRSADESVMATSTTTGTAVTGSRNNGTGTAIHFSFPVGVGDAVQLRADVSVSVSIPLYNDSYIIWSEHMNGIRAFAADSDVSTTVFFAEDDTWNETTAGTFNVTAAETPEVGADNLTDLASGSSKITNWQVLK